MSIALLYTLLKSDLNDVNDIICSALLKDSSNYTKLIVDYVIANQGKQVRPLLVILIFKALADGTETSDSQKESMRYAAACIELIHIASLIHDDILDHASERRNQPSLNVKYGTESALVIGVYFYSTSLKLMAKTRIMDIVSRLGTSVKAMCEGELDQLSGRDNFDLKMDDYVSIIKSKTGILFATAAVCGLLAIDEDHPLKYQCEEFGMHLGTLFQLTDDYLDLFGDGEKLKKKRGQDFFEGQFTLPFIILRDQLSKEEFDDFKRLWDEKPEHSLDIITELSDRYDVRQKCELILQDAYFKTIQFLDSLNPSFYRDGLKTICDMVLERAIGKSNTKRLQKSVKK